MSLTAEWGLFPSTLAQVPTQKIPWVEPLPNRRRNGDDQYDQPQDKHSSRRCKWNCDEGGDRAAEIDPASSAAAQPRCRRREARSQAIRAHPNLL